MHPAIGIPLALFVLLWGIMCVHVMFEIESVRKRIVIALIGGPLAWLCGLIMLAQAAADWAVNRLKD